MQDIFYVKNGNRHFQLRLSEVLYLEAKDKYTAVVTTKREILTLQSLNNMERALPLEIFCRIHRSYLISLVHTTWFDQCNALVGDKTLPIGKSYRNALPARVSTNNGRSNPILTISDYNSNFFRKDQSD